MFEAELFGTIAVALLDAALGILAVAAHVPFAGGTSGTRHGIGAAHDADHEIAGRKAGIGGRLLDAAEQFMANDETLSPRRGPAIVAFDDFAVGTANAERQRAHQNIAVAWRRRRDLFKSDGIGAAGLDGQCAHAD